MVYDSQAIFFAGASVEIVLAHVGRGSFVGVSYMGASVETSFAPAC